MFAVALAFSVVVCVIVTVVLLLFVLAGLSPIIFDQFAHVYPALTVASILTCFPYLYDLALSVLVHPLLTALIHVHFFNAKLYIFLSYQQEKNCKPSVVVVASKLIVAFVVLGIPTLVHTSRARPPGAVHNSDKVIVIHCGNI